MVISLINQKGGGGKITTAINLAGCLSSEGHKTLLVDADPQGSVTQWQATSEKQEFNVIQLPLPDLQNKIKKYRRQFDHIVVDSPPALTQITQTIAATSDLAIIPLAPQLPGHFLQPRDHPVGEGYTPEPSGACGQVARLPKNSGDTSRRGSPRCDFGKRE